MTKGGCAICGKSFYPPTGALCSEHQAVTEEFTEEQWRRVKEMTDKQANNFLRGMADRRRKKRGDNWWLK